MFFPRVIDYFLFVSIAFFLVLQKMYVDADGEVKKERSLKSRFSWREIKRFFWELIRAIELLFAFQMTFCTFLFVFT